MPKEIPSTTLYTGTDLEQLGRELARNLEKHPPTDPFLQDIILVDGKAVSNWLTHAILGSSSLRVHMNAQLMNTRRFGAWAACILEDLTEARGNALNSLPARLYRILGTGTHLESWRKWSGITDTVLEGPKQAEAEVVRWGLAFRLSRHFLDLIRNDAAWITRAEKGDTAGPDDRWSPLWCSAASEIRAEAESRMIHDVDVLEALTNDPKASAHRRKLADAIPGRLTFFATGDVSATLLRILSVLSEVTSVTIYQLQPTEGLHERMTTKGILGHRPGRHRPLQPGPLAARLSRTLLPPTIREIPGPARFLPDGGSRRRGIQRNPPSRTEARPENHRDGGRVPRETSG